MSTTVRVPCRACGDEIAFQIEPWAPAPERAFCGEVCFEQTPSANS